MADKTYVPGVNDNYSPSASERIEATERLNPKRSVSGSATFIPTEDGDNKAPVARTYASNSGNKPLLGFLYSVSRSSFGEYWPLYMGPNTIGRSEKSDIVLNEGTVSSEHATLIIHKEDDGEVYAGIKDNGSTHGVKVNGKSTHFDVVSCNNMDIIKIGKSYELLFILLDAEELGLKKADNFVEVQPETRRVDKRIITAGPQSTMSGSALSSRLKNPSSNDRTRSVDTDSDNNGGGTVLR